MRFRCASLSPTLDRTRMDGSSPETKRLRRNVEWALRRALDPAAVLPMLHRLSRVAPEGTAEGLYAQRLLAELLVDAHPWRAALHARRVLARTPKDDGAWAILALSFALLGHYRSAVSAYRRALEIAPRNAAYLHNLGHLLDVALGRPADALTPLARAYEESDEGADVAVSYAHALGRAGYLAEARRVTRRALEGDGDVSHLREHAALAEWLEHGAKEVQPLLPRRPPSRAGLGIASRGGLGGARVRQRPARKSGSRRPGGFDSPKLEALDAALLRGVGRLPLDSDQRSRTRVLAQRAWMLGVPDVEAAPVAAISAIAAAIAYSIVYVDQVPLTQAEVAACFRVSVPALRGRFKELRAHLDALGPGDTSASRTRTR